MPTENNKPFAFEEGTKFPLEKLEALKTPELRKIVQSNEIKGAEKVEVLVALDLPQLTVEMELGPNAKPRPRSVSKLTDQQQRERERIIKDYQSFLTELTGMLPPWNDTSETFAVAVSPKQLREIALREATKSVSENLRRQGSSDC